MLFITNTQQFFSQMRIALVQVLRDVWEHSPKQIFGLMGLAVVLGFMPYITNAAQGLLLNELVPATKSHVVSSLLLTLVCVAAGAYLFSYVLTAYSMNYAHVAWMDRHQRYDLALSSKLASLDVATHENRVFKDEVQLVHERAASFKVANFLDSLIANVQSFVGVTTASIIVLAVDWRYFALIVVGSVPQLYTELRYGRGMWTIWEGQSEDRRLYSELRHRTEDQHSIRELQTFQTAPYFLGRQRELLSRFLAEEKAQERKKLGLIMLSQVLSAGAILAVLYLLVEQVVVGTLQLGTFSFVLLTALGLEGTVTGFLMNFAAQRADARIVAAYYAIMDRQPFIKQPKKGRRLRFDRAPHIEFRAVTFSYPTAPEVHILEDFSLTIEPGERIALVGVNGAGKSTLIKLLCRFYDPTKGAVLIDGIDLRDIELSDWYYHLALLSQEYDTYQFRAWENIRLGRYTETRDQKKIACAARRTGADQFIEAWKDGYDQQIGQEFTDGTEPSVGQKQKLALARTLYRDALVTILDEPTSSVDAGAEQHIFESLESELNTNQSLILISHRFSTVRQADRICVVENGRVAELGSHEELVAQGGIYANLFEQQAKGYR